MGTIHKEEMRTDNSIDHLHQSQQHQLSPHSDKEVSLRTDKRRKDQNVFSPIEFMNGEVHEIKPTFLQVFTASKSSVHIIILIVLLALGEGSVIGVIPAVMTDRYAHLLHDLPMNETCHSVHALHDRADACLAASADAQQAFANERLVANALTFFTSSLVGSLSDEYGRKPLLILGIIMSCLSPTVLVLLQIYPEMSPFLYYAMRVIQINWWAVAMSAMADVLPPQWRAPSFGLLSAGYSCGSALAPRLAIWFGYFFVSIWSLVMLLLGLVIVVFFLTETVSQETRAQAIMERAERKLSWWYRPLWELSILNRTSLFRMLASLAFFSGMVAAADYSLLVYYIEQHLSFSDKDIANLYLMMGVFGIVVQSIGLKALIERVGERKTIIISFAFGTIQNLLYGVARDKTTIFIGNAIGSGVSMAFPTISAIKANNVQESEQGRIQGALYSVQAVASGLGPTLMRRVYGWSRNGTTILWSPGTMYLFASLFYVAAVYFASYLPVEANAIYESTNHSDETISDDIVVEESNQLV